MPFRGELRTCCVCGNQQRSDSKVRTQWRAVEMGDEIVYACPDEFPSDKASREEFQMAYQIVLACGFQELIERGGKEGDRAVAEYRESRRREVTRNQPKGFGK